MNLLEQTQKLCSQLNIVPSPLKDQHFLIDDKILAAIINASCLNKEDTVLEIGPGIGILTHELAKKVKKVIAIELDRSLAQILQETLAKNVEVIFGNALKILPQQKGFNKMIANIPYQICEPLFHYLCHGKNVTESILMVPLSFAEKAQQHPIFSAFLHITIIQEVPKTAFLPPPKVLSAVIAVVPKQKKDDSEFIRQKLYLQRDKKVKNGVRDTLIDFFGRKHITLTKKEAEKIIDELKLPVTIAEKTIAKLPLKMYEEIARSMISHFATFHTALK